MDDRSFAIKGPLINLVFSVNDVRNASNSDTVV